MVLREVPAMTTLRRVADGRDPHAILDDSRTPPYVARFPAGDAIIARRGLPTFFIRRWHHRCIADSNARQTNRYGQFAASP